MKVFVFAFFALAICSAYGGVANTINVRSGPECKAPNGGGLQPVLDEFLNIISIDDLLVIYMTAVSVDPEVQKVMAYLETENFHKLLNAVKTTPEFYKLMNFACDKLYLDMYYYLNLIGGFLGLPPVERPVEFARIYELVRTRTGLMGMIQDMIDVLPMDKLKAFYEEKSANDEYAKKGLELLSSQDFKNIVKTVENLKEFKELADELRKMGVDVDTIIATLKKFFKWD